MTIFRKILVGTMAAVSMAAAGTTLFAEDSDFPKSWSVNYTNGEPSSVSKEVDVQYLYYYSGGYQTTCTDFSGNGDGYVSVRVNDNQKWLITGVGTVPADGCAIFYSDSKNGVVRFNITAVGNRVTADGTAHLYGYNYNIFTKR